MSEGGSVGSCVGDMMAQDGDGDWGRGSRTDGYRRPMGAEAVWRSGLKQAPMRACGVAKRWDSPIQLARDPNGNVDPVHENRYPGG